MTTAPEEISEAMKAELKKATHQVLNILSYVGETVVNNIRTGATSEWNDQTGNLRSSIGYGVYLDGRPISQSSFPQVLDGAEGVQNGQDYLQDLSRIYSEGIALIVVAGMEYAAYVEAMDNKVVLAGAEIEAKKLVAEMIERLNNGK